MKPLFATAGLLAATAIQAAPPVRSGDGLVWPGTPMQISLRSPRFSVDGEVVGGDLPLRITGRITDATGLRVAYRPTPLPGAGSVRMELRVRWYQREAVLRKWVRLRFDVPGAVTLGPVELERLPAAGSRYLPYPPQSHPVFWDGAWAGVEFPVAATRMEGDTAVIAWQPGRPLAPNTWHESRRMVCAVVARGEETRHFQSYLLARRPGNARLHVNYNSWWTSPVPYTERDILDLMDRIQSGLGPSGTALDSFCIDMGWSDPKTIWSIDSKLFPEGFRAIADKAKTHGGHLGLWISPSAVYAPALDVAHAHASGYETTQVPWGEGTLDACCLGGARYASAFRQALSGLVSRYGLAHVKLDGCFLTCKETDHGHLPDAAAADAIAEGAIAAFDAARSANRDVWLETTCFGWNPSPWWLWHVHSVIGAYGDDAPPGRVPAVSYREAATTGRDYFNLQGNTWIPLPAAAQEVLGVVHQSPDDPTNDIMTVLLRGHRFLPLYLNPAYMNPDRWAVLGEMLRWARKNAPDLGQPEVLLPGVWRDGKAPRFTSDQPMPREPYGYIHTSRTGGMALLRNPWVAEAEVTLHVGDRPGWMVPQGVYQVNTLFPSRSTDATDLSHGSTVSIRLAPWETRVLELVPQRGRQTAVPRTAGTPSVQVSRWEFQRTVAVDRDWFGPNWTVSGPDGPGAMVSGVIAVECASRADLLVLAEHASDNTGGSATASVNGRETPVEMIPSSAGWTATVMTAPEHWTWWRIPLDPGAHTVKLTVHGARGVWSAWCTAWREGRRPVEPGVLPEPERIYTGSACLMAPTDCETAPEMALDRPRVEIDGVYLDTLTPTAAEQGWGVLQLRRSVWEKPIRLGGRIYRRGLGTHAPAKLTYALNGQWRRFEAIAGADQNNSPTVTLEVLVDGRSVWKSGLMTAETPPAAISLDVSGARTLELVAGDGGNGIAGDHVSWADARLLR